MTCRSITASTIRPSSGGTTSIATEAATSVTMVVASSTAVWPDELAEGGPGAGERGDRQQVHASTACR